MKDWRLNALKEIGRSTSLEAFQTFICTAECAALRGKVDRGWLNTKLSSSLCAVRPVSTARLVGFSLVSGLENGYFARYLNLESRQNIHISQ